MIKILFVCHGNICRSPMAEFVMKDLVKKAGLEGEFEIASAAVSAEELGNPVYPPARRMLAAHGIDCAGKRARRIAAGDYKYYDYIIGMDSSNMRGMNRAFGGDREQKLYKLMDFAGKTGADVADPWYTGDFQQTWDDVSEACAALLKQLQEQDSVLLDFSSCTTRMELYQVLREKMAWQDWYGENLDALWDVLTGLPHVGKRFVLHMPRQASEELREYAKLMETVFREAGVLCE